MVNSLMCLYTWSANSLVGTKIIALTLLRSFELLGNNYSTFNFVWFLKIYINLIENKKKKKKKIMKLKLIF